MIQLTDRPSERPAWGARAGTDESRILAITQELRCNERVRITPIRLIDAEGNQAGLVETREALVRAREAGLDLVEVAPNARPPVCRIMDYGKWKYAQKKKDQKTKSHRHESELKMIRIRTPKIGAHDLEIKIAHAREFLGRGDRVQFTLAFRGREMTHQDIGRQILTTVKAGLADIAKVERDFHMEGRFLSMVIAAGAASSKPAKPEGKPKPAKPAVKKPAAENPAGAAPAGGDGAPVQDAASQPVPATAEQAAPFADPSPAAPPAPKPEESVTPPTPQ